MPNVENELWSVDLALSLVIGTPASRSTPGSRPCTNARTIDGRYKAEVIHRRRPWRAFEAIEFATLEGVDWFNDRRLAEPIGDIPPAEAEERSYAMFNEDKLAA